MSHHHGEIPKFAIPQMRSWVPEGARKWIIVAMLLVYQMSGGVYLAAVAEMVGSMALMHEDIMMAGYASLVGLALVFAVMFRLKFRFAPRFTHLVCCTGVIVCNLICMHLESVPALIVVCFVCGIFRMWGTYECNSSIQLWITPVRDMSVWFCWIEFIVQSSICLSGITTIHASLLASWEYMHWVVVGLLLAMMLLTYLLFNGGHYMPRMRLLGVDWFGAFMWAVCVMSVVFVLNYGEHYDWWRSHEIWIGTAVAVVVGALNVWRASFIRHPFIYNSTWVSKPVVTTVLLYLFMDLLLAPSHLFEHIYMEGILGYDAEHVVSLNWVVIFSYAVGAVFALNTFARRKWTYSTMFAIALVFITAYLAMMYFTIDYNLPKEALVLPLFLRGFGYVVAAIILLTALSKMPFNHFFETVCIQGFFSASIAGAFGGAVLNRWLKVAMGNNTKLLEIGLDSVNPMASHLPVGQLYGIVQQQSLIVSMKEIYGWLIIIAILAILGILLVKSDLRPKYAIHPTYSALRRLIKREFPQAEVAADAGMHTPDNI